MFGQVATNDEKRVNIESVVHRSSVFRQLSGIHQICTPPLPPEKTPMLIGEKLH
jgi:hypothetical protein